MGLKEKRLVESVLFSASKPISVDDIKEATGMTSKKINKTLEELIKDYNEIRKNDTSMEVIKAGDKSIPVISKPCSCRKTVIEPAPQHRSNA